MSISPAASSDNLFAAAKSYALGMRLLLSEIPEGQLSPLSMPYHLLGAFSLELSLKSVVAACGGTEAQLKQLGHDLARSYAAALQRGYTPPDRLWLDRMIETLAGPHRELTLRYLPAQLERIVLPDPVILMRVLASHLDAVEDQFPVWSDTPEPPPA